MMKTSYIENHVTKESLDKWLKTPEPPDIIRSYVFCQGSAELGSPYRHIIPVTPFLLAGLATGKVSIIAEFDWNRIAGGFYFVVSKTDIVTQEDVDTTITSMDEADEYMRSIYP